MKPMNRLLGIFARGGKVALIDRPSPQARLFQEEATTNLINFLSKSPDVDEVLKKAGIRRQHLRVLLTDDEIYQAAETRIDAVLSVPMRFEPSEGPGAELLNAILRPVLRDAIAGAFNARLFGYSVLEAVYKPLDGGKYGIKFLGEKPLEWFEPKADGRLMFYPDDGSGGATGKEVDQEFKFFLTRSRASYKQPYGEALLSRLYWPWYFRNNGWKFWAKFLERFGSPLLIGKSQDNTAMVDALLQAHNQAVIGIDRGDSVEAISAGTNNGQAFDAFETAVLRRIQKVVLGQTLTSGTDGKSGSRALGQVHDSVRMDKRASDIDLITGTMQRVVNALCNLNKLEPHKVVFADGTGLETERALRDKDLYAVGVRFTKEYIEDAYDLNPTDFELSSDSSSGVPALPASSAKGSNPISAKAARFSGNGAKAAPLFTAEQQTLELHADAMLEQAPQPIDTTTLRGIVLAATSPEDLERRLIQAAADTLPYSQLATVVEQAIFAADVVGYTEASKDITQTEHDVPRSA